MKHHIVSPKEKILMNFLFVWMFAFSFVFAPLSKDVKKDYHDTLKQLEETQDDAHPWWDFNFKPKGAPPTMSPTTRTPTFQPTKAPTFEPTAKPTRLPTFQPTFQVFYHIKY